MAKQRKSQAQLALENASERIQQSALVLIREAQILNAKASALLNVREGIDQQIHNLWQTKQNQTSPKQKEPT